MERTIKINSNAQSATERLEEIHCECLTTQIIFNPEECIEKIDFQFNQRLVFEDCRGNNLIRYPDGFEFSISSSFQEGKTKFKMGLYIKSLNCLVHYEITESKE